MNNNNCFYFTLLEIKPYTKNDKTYSRVVLYCSFGYLVNIFTTNDKANKLLEKANTETNYDVSNYINVFFDNKRNQFSYIINV